MTYPPPQLVIPYPFRGLFANGERGIIHTAVLEELLFAPLHLHQNLLSLFVLAIHIEHGTAVILLRTQMFRIQIGNILDYLLAKQ